MAFPQTQLSLFQRPRQRHVPARVVAIDQVFPEEAANALAQVECFNKHLFRPNTYLHKWWARRSGTTFRHILKQLSPVPELRDYYTPGGLEGLVILDPMMGGGTTLHEAIRMGATVIGFDLDPIPVLQVRASLTRLALAEKKRVFARFIGAVDKVLRPLFVTRCPTCRGAAETQFVLHGLRKACGCGEVLLVDSLRLREEVHNTELRLESFYPDLAVRRGDGAWKLLEKSQGRCASCGETFRDLTSVRFAERYEPLVLVGGCPEHGQFFKPIEDPDLAVIRRAERAAAALDLPTAQALAVPRGPKSRDLLGREVRSYADLFSARQRLYLATAKRLLEEVDEEHRLWLGLLVSTSLEYNCMLAGYKGVAKCRAGAVRHVFSHHAYSFPYTALECNPAFSGASSGTLRRLFEDRIVAATEWAHAPVERRKTPSGWQKVVVLGEIDVGREQNHMEALASEPRQFLVVQQDSTQMPLPDCSVDFVVTDPPYFDSVQYSDLSHFFRVWLRWFLPGEADWDFDPVTSAVAETEAEAEKFRRVLGQIFGECNRVLRRPHGRLIFTYHHWRADAWVQLTLALKAADFHLVNAFTVFSENPISVHIRRLNALKHDAILVLRPEGGPSNGRWARPSGLANDGSEEFCRTCAAHLGWLLDAECDEARIASAWRELLRGK